jgi:hypothetical protein
VNLPNLQTKPSFEELFIALQSLAIEPMTWSADGILELDFEDVKAINSYLLSIISSGLRWLKVDPSADESASDPKEQIWDLASKRMAERCGRTGW